LNKLAVAVAYRQWFSLPCASNGRIYSKDPHAVISITAFFLAAYQTCVLTFVSIFRALSDPPLAGLWGCHGGVNTPRTKNR
jgi:hypothetical protein